MSDERGSFIKGTYDGQAPYDADELRKRKPCVPLAEESEMHRQIKLAVEHMVFHNAIAIEGLTEKQFSEAIKQSVMAGMGVDELRAKVERMQKCVQVVRGVMFSTECVSSCARNDLCARCKLADALNELDGQTGGEA